MRGSPESVGLAPPDRLALISPLGPTHREVEVLSAYIRAGSVAVAAYGLGISETTARQHLSGLSRRTGCVNAAQAAYWLGRHCAPATEPVVRRSGMRVDVLR